MKTFFKKLEYRFLVQHTLLKTQYFHKKLPCQKPILRQIDWGVQNGRTTKNGVLSLTTLFFKKNKF